MANIEIYTTSICPYCVRAKLLLKRKGVDFNEIPVDQDVERRREMMARSRRQTVPQIFINGTHVGGCDELHALEREGQLDPLLAADDTRD